MIMKSKNILSIIVTLSIVTALLSGCNANNSTGDVSIATNTTVQLKKTSTSASNTTKAKKTASTTASEKVMELETKTNEYKPVHVTKKNYEETFTSLYTENIDIEKTTLPNISSEIENPPESLSENDETTFLLNNSDDAQEPDALNSAEVTATTSASQPENTEDEAVTPMPNSSEIDVLTFNISLPQIDNTEGLGSINKFNNYYKDIEEKIKREISEQYVSEAESMLDTLTPDNFSSHWVDCAYTVTYNANGIISILRKMTTYTGGVHSNITYFSETFDLTTGQLLNMYDIFRLTRSECNELITSILDEQLDEIVKSSPDDLYTDVKTLAHQYLDMNSFYLTNEGITLYYQIYEIASYSYGAPEFSISYDRISQHLRKGLV